MFKKNNLKMARPKRYRHIRHKPVMKGFKPFGIRYVDSEKVYILPEEYEAMKLIDFDGLTQEEAAYQMKVSRPTITRIYQNYRRKIAEAFVENKSILFESADELTYDTVTYYCNDCGKSFEISNNSEIRHCVYCGSNNITLKKSTDMKTINFEPGFGFGGGRGRGHGQGRGRGRHLHHGEHHHDDDHLHMGPTGYCICPKCGKRYEKIAGVPCTEMRCEECGSALVREGSEHHKLILERQKKKNRDEND